MAVMGVGNVKAQAQGRGTIKLELVVNGQTYILKLQDVLYIPTNEQNLISLGCWDGASSCYIGGGGIIKSNCKEWKTCCNRG